MAVQCQTISVLSGIPKGSSIQIISTANQIIKTYEWYMDSVILPYNNNIITINTSNLNIGVHTLLLKAQSSCNNWGSYSQSFYITETCNNLITSFNIQII